MATGNLSSLNYRPYFIAGLNVLAGCLCALFGNDFMGKTNGCQLLECNIDSAATVEQLYVSSSFFFLACIQNRFAETCRRGYSMSGCTGKNLHIEKQQFANNFPRAHKQTIRTANNITHDEYTKQKHKTTPNPIVFCDIIISNSPYDYRH